MIDPVGLIEISVSAIFVNNFILARCIGVCPLFDASTKLSRAIAMGGAVIFAMAVASAGTWIINRYLLIPFQIEYLQTLVFILGIAGIVKLAETALQKYSPTLYESLGAFLLLFTANCAVLGVALINMEMNPATGEPYGFIESLANGVMSGVGFTVVLVLLAGIREKIGFAPVPKVLEGLPIAFITAGLMSLAFLGFSGLHFFKGAGG